MSTSPDFTILANLDQSRFSFFLKSGPAQKAGLLQNRGEHYYIIPKEIFGKSFSYFGDPGRVCLFLVHALFCRESLYFQIFIRERFICELFLEKFYKLGNYTYYKENFPLEKLAIHCLQRSSVTRIIYFLKTLPSDENPGKDSFAKLLPGIQNSSWEKSMKFFNYSLSRADSLGKEKISSENSSQPISW